MYIGPWQEYRLSKQRTVPREAVPILAADLQNALLKTLDPVAAHAAMRVMQSYLANSASSNLNSGIIDQLTIPFDEAPARHQTRPTLSKQHLQHNPVLRLPLSDPQYKEYFNEGNGEPRAYKFQQPNSDRKFLPLRNTAREVLSLNYNNNQYQSPLSVRSTKSEPVRNLPSLLRISNASARPQPGLTLSSYEPRTITLPVASKEPSLRPKRSNYEPGQQSYDQSALVSFLRIEREQRARAAEIAQQAFSLHQSVESKLQEAPIKKVDPLALQCERKLQHVEQMKQLYLSKGPPPSLKFDSDNDTYASNKGIDGIQGASPQRPVQPPPLAGHTRPVSQYKPSFESDTPTATSRLEDITEITDEHLMRVSKYFSSSLDGPNVVQMPSVIIEPPPTSLPSKDEHERIAFDDEDDYMSISLYDHMLVKNNSMDGLPPQQQQGNHSGSRSNVESSPDLMITTTVDLDHYMEVTDEANADLLVDKSLQEQQDRARVEEGEEEAKEVTIIEDLHLSGGGLDSLLRWSASLDHNDGA